MDADTPDSVALRGTETAAVRAAVADAGATVVERDPDAVVVVGERALLALADEPPDVPVLPVADRPRPLTVAPADLAADVTLVTSESARISEFAVRAGGRRVDDFRADGVVVATPLGSAGYARAAGGPVVEPGTGLAVVPVAEFATFRGAWVLDPPVGCTVERDEVPVSLVLDGAVVDDVGVGQSLRVVAVDALDLLVAVDGVESF